MLGSTMRKANDDGFDWWLSNIENDVCSCCGELIGNKNFIVYILINNILICENCVDSVIGGIVRDYLEMKGMETPRLSELNRPDVIKIKLDESIKNNINNIKKLIELQEYISRH